MKVKYEDLAGKKILITGSNRGIGRDIARFLGAQGSHVLLNHRSGDVNDLIGEIESLGGQATPAQFDITDYESAEKFVKEFTEQNGVIDCLVNNAGVNKDTLLLRLKEDEIDTILNTNLKAAMILTRILCRGFLRSESASIVNISSIVGLMGNPAQSAYSAAKAGLIGFTKSVAKELGGKGVRCNAVCPGFINTDMTKKLSEQVQEEYLKQIPLKRWGDAEEVASLTAFLLSQASSYITGEVIKVDGGIYI